MFSSKLTFFENLDYAVLVLITYNSVNIEKLAVKFTLVNEETIDFNTCKKIRTSRYRVFQISML